MEGGERGGGEIENISFQNICGAYTLTTKKGELRSQLGQKEKMKFVLKHGFRTRLLFIWMGL
jgi:hypothetical protein